MKKLILSIGLVFFLAGYVNVNASTLSDVKTTMNCDDDDDDDKKKKCKKKKKGKSCEGKEGESKIEGKSCCKKGEKKACCKKKASAEKEGESTTK